MNHTIDTFIEKFQKYLSELNLNHALQITEIT